MTDKQIISDGVDVAGCIRLQDDEISCDLGGECKGWGNCYYKQLKRREQTLIEIKEMCREMNCESLMENSWCGNTDFKMGCCEKFLKKQILQKISEVINES